MGRNRIWYEQWDKRRTANIDKFHGFRVSPFNDSIILFDDFKLLLALFHDPPTFYEIFKMAKKLGEMDNDFYILLNSSDLKQISKHLLETAKAENNPNIELIGVANDNLILLEMAKAEMRCRKKKKEIKKYIDNKDLYNGKTPKVDFNPINDLKQIVPEIIREIEQMLQKSDWNYANLKYLKMDELILLKYDLHKMGNDQKWEEIEQLRGEWEKAFNDWYFKQNEENRPNFEEMMRNLIKMLSNIDFSGEGNVSDSVVLRALKRAKIA
uniref:Uncharacterized protein n=1 Tax=Globodera rostochiensis TaxID=31243 RepID=A0A914HPL8_GLORO